MLRRALDIHLIDGTYELFRHYYALPSARDRRGTRGGRRARRTGVGAGHVEAGATHIAVATDHVIESFRNDLWPGYKTGEGIDPELLAQFPLLEETLTAAGIVVWPMMEFEADDALASAAGQRPGRRVERVIICTPDKDLAQCVRGTRIVQLDRRRASCTTKPAWSRSSASGRSRFPTISRWSATRPTVIRAWRAGARSRRPRFWPSSSISSPFLRIGASGTCQRGQRQRPGAHIIANKRDSAMLFRTLATLRTNIPLFEDVEQLRWKAPKN